MALKSSIKKRGFSRLGVEMDGDRLELFRDFCHLNHEKLASNELAVADLILEMETANKQSAYFPTIFLHDRLKELWLSLYLNNANSGLKKRLARHAIQNHFSLDVKNRLKIRIKSILR